MNQIKLRVPSKGSDFEQKKKQRQERESRIIQEAVETRSICLESENLQEISEAVVWLVNMRKVAQAHGWKSVLTQIDKRLEEVKKTFEEIQTVFS